MRLEQAPQRAKQAHSGSSQMNARGCREMGTVNTEQATDAVWCPVTSKEWERGEWAGARPRGLRTVSGAGRLELGQPISAAPRGPHIQPKSRCLELTWVQRVWWFRVPAPAHPPLGRQPSPGGDPWVASPHSSHSANKPSCQRNQYAPQTGTAEGV